MDNNKIVGEWTKFADMDYKTAIFLFETMYPKPLEIICYHCQQAVEKLLKGLLIANDKTMQKTHDLGILIALLQEIYDIPEEVLDVCDNLTPYGVKVRYPQELFIEEDHAKKAIQDMKQLFE